MLQMMSYRKAIVDAFPEIQFGDYWLRGLFMLLSPKYTVSYSHQNIEHEILDSTSLHDRGQVNVAMERGVT
jgi:hypothetical protein